jgi:hypothetical protein
MNPCPDCGANMDLVGRRHRCITRESKPRKNHLMAEAFALAEPRVKAQPKRKRAKRGTFDRNAYQREYMRKYRAKK